MAVHSNSHIIEKNIIWRKEIEIFIIGFYTIKLITIEFLIATHNARVYVTLANHKSTYKS